jgi:hypothetical protein
MVRHRRLEGISARAAGRPGARRASRVRRGAVFAPVRERDVDDALDPRVDARGKDFVSACELYGGEEP